MSESELDDGDENFVHVTPASWLTRMFGDGVTPAFPDLTLRVGKEWSMGTHRGVLASSIPYFQRALTEGWAEWASGEMKFSTEQVRPESLRAVVSTSYGVRIPLSDDNVCDIHATANFLGLEKGFADKCVRFMMKNLKPTTVVHVCLYAQGEFPGSSDLLDQSLEFVRSQFHVISNTPDFLKLKWENLESLSSLDNLRKLQPESVILDGYLKWLNWDWVKRHARVSKVLKRIDWAQVDFGVMNECESVDQVRNRVCDTDSERLAEGLLSKKLLCASKGRFVGTEQPLQDPHEGLGVDIIERSSRLASFAYVAQGDDVRDEVSYRVRQFNRTSGGSWQRVADEAPDLLFCADSQVCSVAFANRQSCVCVLRMPSEGLEFHLLCSDNDIECEFRLSIPLADMDAVDCKAVHAMAAEKLCVLLTSVQHKWAKKLFVFCFQAALKQTHSTNPNEDISPVYSLAVEQVMFRNGLAGCSICVVGSCIVLVGGMTASSVVGNASPGVHNREFWILDLNSCAWTEGPPFPYETSNPSLCAAEDYLFVSGGSREGNALAAAFCHKLGTKFWTRLPPMRAPRERHSLVVCGDRLVALGGSSQGCRVNFAEELDLNCLSKGWKEVEQFKNLKEGFASSY